MLGRLIIGMLKGLIVGGLLGFGLAKVGFAVPIAIVAYLAAALSGVLIGLVAGKPIWAKDAKIEAGMKAVVGALLGSGLMYAVRRWLGDVPMPFSLGEFGEASSGAQGTVGTVAMSSLALVAAVLGGFYEADNTPEDPTGSSDKEKTLTKTGKRIVATDDLSEDETDVPPEHKRAKN